MREAGRRRMGAWEGDRPFIHKHIRVLFLFSSVVDVATEVRFLFRYVTAFIDKYNSLIVLTF
jgi:hypothetical protein